MFPDLFNDVNLLQKGLDAAQLRQDVIANNIANVDTPGFKASHVEFETLMQQALSEDDDTFVGKRTNPKHIAIGSADSPEEVQARVVQDSDSTMRMDENNVDVDAQMVEMIKNSVYYNTLTLKLSNQLDRLKMAIDGK